MRIAQVWPLEEAVPPKLYGGTERIISFLTEELVVQGHDVTLKERAQDLFPHGCAIHCDVVHAVPRPILGCLSMIEDSKPRANVASPLNYCNGSTWNLPAFMV